MSEPKKRALHLAFIVLFVCGAFVGTLSYGIYEWANQVRNVGVIRVIGVEIYRDEALTEMLEVIDWGMLEAAENKSYPAWIKNTGNDAQKLLMWTETWNPQNASDFVSLTWNYNDSWIPSNTSIPIQLTLSIDINISGITNFSFVIWIKGVH